MSQSTDPYADRMELYESLPDIRIVAGTTADHLYSVLEEAIINGTLAPGSHLKPTLLSQRFGVSMIPVRESLRTLQANGWVVSKPHRGSYVRFRTEAELEDLFEARSILETAVCRLAAQHRSDEDLHRLTEAVDSGFQLLGSDSLDRFDVLNSEFHELIAECSHNAALIEFQQRLNKRVRFYSSILPLPRIEQSIEEHAAIADSIKERRPADAEALASRHVAQSKHKLSGNLSVDAVKTV